MGSRQGHAEHNHEVFSRAGEDAAITVALCVRAGVKRGGVDTLAGITLSVPMICRMSRIEHGSEVGVSGYGTAEDLHGRREPAIVPPIRRCQEGHAAGSFSSAAAGAARL